MARVDPDDDDIRRYVVYHYAYDPSRRERRHQVLAAFDSRREFARFLKTASAGLRRRESGQDAGKCEHISGTVLEPGHRRLRQNARVLTRAIRHGADISALLDHLELPPSVAVIQARSEDARGGR